MDKWYRLLRGLFNVYVRLCIDEIVTIGQENLPPGSKIIVGNHPNASDGLALPAIVPEHLHFAAQSELFTLPIIGEIFKRSGQLPVTKGEGKKFLKIARERLEAGDTVVIFPEGRLNMNGELQRAGSGAAVLALQTGAPILPVGIYAPTESVRVIRSRFYGRDTIGSWQFGGKIYFNFGKAIHLHDPEALRSGDREVVRTYIEEIMQQVEQLSVIAAQFARKSLEAPRGAALSPGAE